MKAPKGTRRMIDHIRPADRKIRKQRIPSGESPLTRYFSTKAKPDCLLTAVTLSSTSSSKQTLGPQSPFIPPKGQAAALPTLKLGGCKLNSAGVHPVVVAPKCQPISAIQSETTHQFFAFHNTAVNKTSPTKSKEEIRVKSPKKDDVMNMISRTLSFCSLMSETDLMMD